jgi:hypothetical protein
MNDLDTALQTYFAPRDEIPQEVRARLRAKLAEQLQNEKIPPIWIAAPFALLASVAIILGAGAVFGSAAAFFLGAAYYSVAAITVASVIILMKEVYVG